MEAVLYEKLQDNRVRCNVCPRHCCLKEGQRGFCQVRQNQQGRLLLLTYGEVASLSINPVEKKPVFHFYPGSRWLSLGSLGCNFRCPGCQNWEIAHAQPGQRETRYLTPQESIQAAQHYGCQGVSWTFNEPTIWLEYTLEGAKLARKQGLYTNYVTNGYITLEALDLLGPYLDVFRVDIKGFSRSSYGSTGHISDFSSILEATQRARERWGMHIEVVTNIIPGYNDAEEELRRTASWIRGSLSPFIPWHLTRFFPRWRLSHLEPTPVATLEKAMEWAKEEGLLYVYLGNVPGHPTENTYCHHCGKMLIRRFSLKVIDFHIVKGRCYSCGTEIPGRFEDG